MGKQLAAFEKFIDDLRAIWSSEPDDERRMTRAKPLLEALTRDPDLLQHSKSWPNTVGQNLLLYEDPEAGFVVNAVVRPVGYKGGVHDHAHAWVLYGVLDGWESLERFERLDDGSTPGHAVVRKVSATKGMPGSVDIVPPFNIHAEQGGDGRSVAMIVRSQRLVGRVLQNGFNLADHTVVQRSGPEQVPFSLTVT
jgi:predicted metal-dependent enzyme (double-stranded beta helix superfamily)